MGLSHSNARAGTNRFALTWWFGAALWRSLAFGLGLGKGRGKNECEPSEQKGNAQMRGSVGGVGRIVS